MASDLPENHDRGPLVLAVDWVFASLSFIAVFLRFYVRTVIKPGILGWDDWSILVAFFFAVVDAYMEIPLVNHGVGRHLAYVDPKNLPTVAMWTLISSIVNALGIMFVKISVSLFLLRMVRGTYISVLWLTTVNLAIMVPFTIVTCFVDLFQCIPVQGYWNKDVHAKCMKVNTVNVFLQIQSALGVFTDFLTVSIALVVILRLQMRRAKKATISFLLGLGYLIVASSIAKTVEIHWTPSDFTWDVVPVSIAGNIEYFAGIIVTCLPTLHPLIPALASKLGTMRGTSKGATAHTADHPNTELSTYLASAKARQDRSTSEEKLVYGSGGTIQRTTEVYVASHRGRVDDSHQRLDMRAV